MKVESPSPLRGVFAVFAASALFVPATLLAQDDDLFAVDPDAETIPVTPVDEDTQSAAVADAIDEGATELDAVEVTGSRIKRTDYETAHPVLVISRDDIEKTGMVAIGEILQDLPQAGAALNRAFNNGGNGAINIDLRNLGSNRVLVLVNGRRWINGVSQFNTSGVDLTTIPVSVIESIEILKDGASAIYGSDAIAGVVNIKTRRDYVGAEIRGHAEATDRGDGVTSQIGFSGGTIAGRTSVFFDVSYVNQGEVLSGDREQSRIPTLGTGTTRGSRFLPNTNTIVVPTQQNSQAINAAAAAAGFSGTGPTAPCYDIAGAVAEGQDENVGDAPVVPVSGALDICDMTLDPDGLANGQHTFVRFDQNTLSYNYAPVNYLLTPSERTGIFGQLSHQLFDATQFSMEVLYNIRKSTQQLAFTPSALGDAFGRFHPFDVGYVHATNPYNPTNPQSPYYIPGAQPQDIGYADPNADGLIGLGAVLRRFEELGPRIFNQDVATWRIGGGVDGSFDVLDRFVAWDAGYIFGENRLENVNNGLINQDRLARASGDIARCEGDGVNIPEPDTAECVAFDWFGGGGSLTQEMLDYVKYTALDVNQQRQRIGYLNVSSEIGEAMAFLPAPIGIAMGGEVREEYFKSTPDPLKVIERSSTNSVKPTIGEYTVREGYLELFVPVLADITFDDVGLGGVSWLEGVSLAEELDLSVAGRYSDYDGFGSNLSGKLGLRYKVNDDVLIRSTWSDSFRAPAITDLFLGQAQSFPSVDDPCEDTEPGTNAETNCAADGTAGVNSPSQVPTIFGGNPDLSPETATTLSAGFVWSPEFIQDFNTYVDWYKIEMEDFISPLGPGAVLALCYDAPPDQRSFCDRVQRGTTGAIERIDAKFTNFSSLNVEGVDINMDWIMPFEFLQPYGQFKWTMDAAYVAAYDVITPTPGGESEVGLVGLTFGGAGAIPRWKIKSGINWTLGEMDATWNARYIHHVIEVCEDPFGPDPGTAESGDILSNPTPVLSLDQFGLCSEGAIDRFDGAPANKLDEVVYNDVQFGYNLPVWNARFVIGVLNVLDQDPPPSYSAFADTMDKATHEIWGSRSLYLRSSISF